MPAVLYTISPKLASCFAVSALIATEAESGNGASEVEPVPSMAKLKESSFFHSRPLMLLDTLIEPSARVDFL